MATESDTKRYVSTAELRTHNTPTDIWISIQGKVYDVTSWLKDHPGGERPLINLAGSDVTDAFVAYHPASAWTFLSPFFVGYLSDYKVSETSKDYRRLVAEFSKLGLFEKKGHLAFASLCSMVVLFFAAVYGVLGSSSTFVHLVSGVLIGFLWMQSGFIGHDSGHYKIVPDARINRLLQIVSGNCVTGLSIAWWKRAHNVHHVAVNHLECDPDLQHMPVFAVSSWFFGSLTSRFYKRKMNFDSIARFLVSYQHWTFYPVMIFARFNLFAQSLFLLASKEKVDQRWHEIVGVIIFWVWYPLLVSCLPNWRERIMFVIVNFAVTAIQHIQFCLNHFSAEVFLEPPCGNDWLEKQTKGTLNISCSPWMDWFHGGLQFQVEHHLFPRLPRCHFRRIAPIVRELCKKHSLTYPAASFWGANVRTIRTLWTAAMQARDVANPVPKNLVWAAVNTHG